MIEKILGFMEEAGKLAVLAQKGIDLGDAHKFKEEYIASIVTETDIKISAMFKEFVEAEFGELDYVIVDEEALSGLGDKPFEKIAKSEYSFVIDPIDGTLPYSLKMPEYGILIGVLKYGKPYIGAVYAPAMGDLAYFDGKKAYWLQDAFTADERKVELEKGVISLRAVMIQSSSRIKTNDKHNHRKDVVMDLYSAAVHLLYMVTGRAKAYYFGAHPWDMAGAWPICKYLGIEFMNIHTGEVLSEISSRYFTDNWKAKEVHVVCRPKDFEHFKSIVEVR